MSVKEGDPSGMRVILKYKQDLELKNGILYRKVKLQNLIGLYINLYYRKVTGKEQSWLSMMTLVI